MVTDDPRRVVLASVEAYNRHDLDGCLACFAPDATWEIAGSSQRFPIHDVALVLEQYFAADAKVTIRGLAAADTLVAAEYLERYHDERTQQPMVRALAIFYTVEQGKIRHARQYAHPDWTWPAEPGAPEA